MKLFLRIITMGLPILLMACASFGGSRANNEVVMTEGMIITATTDLGTIRIEAGKGFERIFTWAGDSRSVILWPRKERWNGSFGLYFPGVGNHWKEHDGVTRIVVEEGKLYFNSSAELLSYLDRFEDKENLVYSDDGLFVYWEKRPGADGTLSVLIWQFLIKGKKPTFIPGSNNTLLTVKELGSSLTNGETF